MKTYEQWKQETLDGIDQSLHHWKNVRDNGDTSIGCGLCALYLNDKCVNCPVGIFYGPNCSNTSFEKLVSHNKTRKAEGIPIQCAVVDDVGRPIIDEIIEQLETVREGVLNGSIRP